MGIRLTHEEYGKLQFGCKVIWGAFLFWMLVLLLMFPQCGVLLPRTGQETLQAIRDYTAANPLPPRPGL